MTDINIPPGPSRLEAWLRRFLLLGPIYFGLAATAVIVSRVNYPFELEWMEGGSLIQVLRILDGKPLYVSPTLSYIPYIYPPLYYYLAAFAAKISGNEWFLPLRLVSVAATFGTLFLIYLIVRKLTGLRYWGIIAAGLFVASFRLGGAWFDIARVDMLYVFLLIAGVFFLIGDSRISGLAGGFLFALSFYTKQTALLPALAVLAYLLLSQKWRKALEFGTIFAGFSLLMLAIENGLSRGWYAYYVFHLPSLHRIAHPVWLALIAETAVLLGALAIAATLSALPFLVTPRKSLRENHGLLGLITIAAIIVSIAGKVQPGGYDNANLPALATISILAGMGGYWLEYLLRSRNRRTILPILFLLMGTQYAMLYFNIASQIPSIADRTAGEQIVMNLRQTPGNVLVPFHPYIALMAGKPVSAHQVTLWEISGKFGLADVPNWTKLSAEINSDIRYQRFQRILLDRTDPIWKEVPIFYAASPIKYGNPSTFIPVTGGPARPNLDYLPKKP